MNPNSNSDEIVSKVLEALKQTDVWKFVEKLMGDQQAPAEEPGMEGPAGEEELPMEDEAEEPVDDEVPVEDEEEPAKLQRYSATPAANNTFVPSGNGRRAPQRPAPKKADPGRVKMQRDQLAGKLARLEAQRTKDQAEIKALRLRFQRADREKDLIQLESEGYEFDRAEELERLAQLPKPAYDQQLGIIRKRYRKGPVGGDPLYTVDRSPSRQGRDRSKAMEIAEFAREHNISYEDALKQVEGSEKLF